MQRNGSSKPERLLYRTGSSFLGHALYTSIESASAITKNPYAHVIFHLELIIAITTLVWDIFWGLMTNWG